LVNPGTPQAWEIQLKSGVNRLGRGEDNDFQVPHASVSGTHCEITVSSAGAILKDLGSTNGTFVNRAPVHEAILQTGQHVQLGIVDMVFESTPIAAAAAPGVLPPAPPPVTARMTGSRLTVAQSPTAAASPVVEPAPTEAEPPLAPPVPLKASGAFCKSHVKTPARFYCNKCHHYFCDLCVATLDTSAGPKKACRSCGADLTPVQVHVTRPADEGFFARLPGAFSYPFHGRGTLVLIVGTMVLAAFKIVGGFFGALFFGMIITLVLQVMVAGYIFCFQQNIIHATAAEDAELPDLPDAADIWEDLLLPGLRLIGLVLIAFSPLLALTFLPWSSLLTAGSLPPGIVIATVLAVIFGCSYFPMAFLAVAMKDSILAANPLVVVPAILKVPLEYLVILVLTGVIFAVRHSGDMALGFLSPGTIAAPSLTRPLLMFGAQAFWTFAQLYLLTVNVRILGLLYVTNKKKLEWF
jgi:hypothetical protein